MEREHRTAAQREFWAERYGANPNFFGSRESDFAHWAERHLGSKHSGGTLVELGAGNGRDLRYFEAQGYRVRGVDCAGDVPAKQLASLRALQIECQDAFDFLKELETEMVDVVYSNLFYNMDFSETEHHAMFREVQRALRPGGHHFYSVRTTLDRWYGRGIKKGPDTFDSTPEGTTMHFFSPEYASGLRARAKLTLLDLEELEKGQGDFPIHVIYVAEQRKD